MAARSRGWKLLRGRLGLFALLTAVTALLALLLLTRWGEDALALLVRRDQTWSAMQSRGAWRVALDPSFPPFETLDASGAPAGFDVDLARRLAADWGLELEIVAMGFDSLLDAVKAGKVDSVVSAMPYDPRATRDYAYSSPYFDAGVALVARAGAPIQGIADLAGKIVAVEWGSMGDMVGRRLQRDDASIVLQPFPTPAEAVQALVDDPSVDALLVDRVTLREAQGSGAALIEVGPVLESNPYVIVMPLHATTLHERVAETLQRFRQEGVLGELEEVWFRSRE